MKFYVVGGYVRDLVLGNKPKDVDYLIVDSSVEEMEMLGFKQVGADFPVFLHPIHKSELALARTERKISSGYLGFECKVNNVTLLEDCSRRDFTINSMALRVRKMDDNGFPILGVNNKPIDVINMIDYYNGLKDLKDKILRHVSPAFSEDPVRALRACRFAARYNFSIAPETILLIEEMKVNGELNSLVPERIWLEITKALSSDNPHLFFKTAKELGIGFVIHNLYLDSFIKNLSGYSIEQQTVLLGLSNIKNPDIFNIFEKLKVPLDCQTATRKFFKIKNLLVNPTPERFMQVVEILEMTHTWKWLNILSPIIVDWFPNLHENWDIVNRLKGIMDINFDSLEPESRIFLQGPEIGQAIRSLRVEFIKIKLEMSC